MGVPGRLLGFDGSVHTARLRLGVDGLGRHLVHHDGPDAFGRHFFASTSRRTSSSTGPAAAPVPPVALPVAVAAAAAVVGLYCLLGSFLDHHCGGTSLLATTAAAAYAVWAGRPEHALHLGQATARILRPLAPGASANKAALFSSGRGSERHDHANDDGTRRRVDACGQRVQPTGVLPPPARPLQPRAGGANGSTGTASHDRAAIVRCADAGDFVGDVLDATSGCVAMAAWADLRLPAAAYVDWQRHDAANIFTSRANSHMASQ